MCDRTGGGRALFSRYNYIAFSDSIKERVAIIGRRNFAYIVFVSLLVPWHAH
jgi:hypothetical protein